MKCKKGPAFNPSFLFCLWKETQSKKYVFRGRLPWFITIGLSVPDFSERCLVLLKTELHSRYVMSGFIEAEAWTTQKDAVGGRTASHALSPTHCSSCHWQPRESWTYAPPTTENGGEQEGSRLCTPTVIRTGVAPPQAETLSDTNDPWPTSQLGALSMLRGFTLDLKLKKTSVIWVNCPRTCGKTKTAEGWVCGANTLMTKLKIWKNKKNLSKRENQKEW